MSYGDYVQVEDATLVQLRESLLKCQQEFDDAKNEIDGIVRQIIGDQWNDDESRKFMEGWRTEGQGYIIKFTDHMGKFAQYLDAQYQCLVEYHNKSICLT